MSYQSQPSRVLAVIGQRPMTAGVRSAFAALTAVAVLVGTPNAWGQESGPATEPVGVDATAEEPADVVRPTRVIFPEQAYFLLPGQLQLETDYAANFISGAAPNLHVFDVLAVLAVADLVEVRLGWDYLGIAGDATGVGDLLLGVKGGFFGGLREQTALAGFVDMQLPTGASHVGIGEGIRFFGGLVASQLFGPVQLDLEVAFDTHLFTDDPAFLLPISLGMRWEAWRQLWVYADGVLSLDLTDLSETRTSLLAGAGWRIIPRLEVNATARVGLSQNLPDLVLQVGVAWMVWDLW